jgi:hypothetical protein
MSKHKNQGPKVAAQNTILPDAKTNLSWQFSIIFPRLSGD